MVFPIPLVDRACRKICSLYAGFYPRINVFNDKMVERRCTGNTIVEHAVCEIVIEMIPLKVVHRFIHTDVNTSFERVLADNPGYEGPREIIIDDLLSIPQPTVDLILPEHRICDVEITISDTL